MVYSPSKKNGLIEKSLDYIQTDLEFF